ncbi:hypothetical protein [Actinoallomurus sp. CA-150999]|uniref:hypothetical protein n=1 Tax=Actinoallomurus sp. CA-150999 TaxID=3239887 RepID=UPI003D92CA33
MTFRRRRLSGRDALIAGVVGWGLYLTVFLVSQVAPFGPSPHDRVCQSYRDDERILSISLYPSSGSSLDGTEAGRAAMGAAELQRQQEHDTLVTSHPDCFSAQQVQAASARLRTTVG